MERDPKLAKLIRESGIVRAPDRFSENVMSKIIRYSVTWIVMSASKRQRTMFN